MGIELIQKTELNLSQLQIQNLQLLQMNAVELSQYIEDIAKENPMIDLPEFVMTTPVPTDDRFLTKWQWFENSDHQNLFNKPYGNGDEDRDILETIGNAGGLDITLTVHLKEQAARMKIDADTYRELEYLIDLLDERGYLRMTKEEIARNTGLKSERICRAVSMLQSMDPPGVGAFDLSECLVLQLKRIGAGPLPITIASRYLNNLARNQIRRIAEKENVGVENVLEAVELIRKLYPNPARDFDGMDVPIYIRPDVYVDRVGKEFFLREIENQNSLFTVNEYYYHLLKTTEDTETRKYLQEKMSQIEALSYGLEQRRTTLEKLCRLLIQRQKDFFQNGQTALRPLSMSDAAEEMGVHISTISRTVKNKYMQYPGGIIPLKTFFVRTVSEQADNEGGVFGPTEIKDRIRSFLKTEDRNKPLTDQKICNLLAKENIHISRRTVAKYRDDLGIPAANDRKQF